MDVLCATCQEPWEVYYLLNDLPWDVWDGNENSSSYLLADKFINSRKVDIPKMLRDDLEVEGWTFGRTIVCVLTCGCCASNAGECEEESLVKLRKDLRLEAEELMGDDLDGIISTISGIDAYASGDR